MWKLKEFRWYIYNNYSLIIFKTVILFLVLGLIYTFLLFSRDLFNTDNNFKNLYSDRTMYELIYLFDDADSFYAFRDSDESMAGLKTFYDDLNREKSFSFLSTCDQSISVTDFKGDNKFKDGNDNSLEFNDKLYEDIKSVQINKKAFDFYHLKIDKGSYFKWNQINYANNKIPVILGADYEGIYHIGDIIEANFYSLNVEFQVIGFLQTDSTIYHKYEVRRCLDQYILVPYPEKGYENMDKYFRGILYSSMINGNIVVQNSDSALQFILDKLSELSKHSGYYQYTLIGIPIFAVQYNMVISTVQANKNLITAVLVLLICITTFIMGSISYFLYQRRRNIYEVYTILGYSKQEIHRMIFREMSFPYIAAFILLIIYYYCKLWLFVQCAVYLALINLTLMMSIYWFLLYLHRRDNKDNEQ
ncbi:hypothetical protein [Aminipila sp.]|uniref:hypothetical protein n=1 Tax=Aminipila sp. TaxID=2060095 RepID=UPI00289E6640|nr:hypothetical protein [Aminipila sp.]